MATLGILRVNESTANLTDDSGWVSDDLELQNILNILYPFPDLLSEGYDPNPAQTVLEAAAAGEGGEIIQPVTVNRYEGVVY